MKLSKAVTFLENVTTKTMAVPMRRYAGSTGRTAQGELPLKISMIGRKICGMGNSIANITTAMDIQGNRKRKIQETRYGVIGLLAMLWKISMLDEF
jgi:ribosomal protein L22